jgi:hypothetical protein
MRKKTPFLRRVEMAHSIGRIVKSNGKYLSLPLEHRRPREPFQSRLTLAENAEVDAWFARLNGENA